MGEQLIDLTSPLNWAAEHAAVEPKPQVLHEDELQKVYLLTTKTGPQFPAYDKVPEREAHTITTVEGFIDYLQSRNADRDGIVFVNCEKIYCRLLYRDNNDASGDLHHNPACVTVPLLRSEEFAALRDICQKATGQKELRDLLIGPLAGTLDVHLELLVSSIRIAADKMSQVQIDASGLAKSEAGRSVAITFPLPRGNGATETKELPLEWTWTGRIYEAFDREYEIVLRLDLGYSEDTGLRFRFIPRRLDRVLRQARLDLVADLKGKVPPKYSVHEGTF